MSPSEPAPLASQAEAPDVLLPDFADIEAAARRIADQAVVTPLLENPLLNRRAGFRVLVKPECLQRTGSFKFRGAMNRIALIPEAERARGVVAFSSGNHAQGVAAAAEIFGVPATIVMPHDAPRIKVENTRGYGAEVIFYRRPDEDREAVAGEVIARTGATLIRPYDDPGIIAGQGTCGLEIAQEAARRGIALERLLVCCGGGGFTAGCALALEELSPGTIVNSVEPAGFDDTARSLAAGERLGNAPGAQSFCDALLSPKPGLLTFEVNRRLVPEGLAVTDAEVAEAMAYAFKVLKLVVEPGGAVCLAAVLSGKVKPEKPGESCVAITLSGGNVDPETFCKALQAG